LGEHRVVFSRAGENKVGIKNSNTGAKEDHNFRSSLWLLSELDWGKRGEHENGGLDAFEDAGRKWLLGKKRLGNWNSKSRVSQDCNRPGKTLTKLDFPGAKVGET